MASSTIRHRLDTLLNALVQLRRYRDFADAGTLEADVDKRYMVLHGVYLATQAAIDLAFHVAARHEQETCARYQDVFDRLRDAGLLDAAQAQRLAGWAGLRNVIAHRYIDLDYRVVAKALREELDDLEDFAVAAASWLEEES